jgi:hypothetical protein
VVGEALICLGFNAVAKNHRADNFSKRQWKLNKSEPSLRQNPEIPRSIQGWLCVQSAGPLTGPQGWRVPRHRLSGFGLDHLPTAWRMSRQAPMVKNERGRSFF